MDFEWSLLGKINDEQPSPSEKYEQPQHNKF